MGEHHTFGHLRISAGKDDRGEGIGIPLPLAVNSLKQTSGKEKCQENDSAFCREVTNFITVSKNTTPSFSSKFALAGIDTEVKIIRNPHCRIIDIIASLSAV